MSSEKDETYRDNLERIINRFPGKEILTYKEVQEYTGKGYRVIKRLFPEPKFGGIPIVLLARMLS